MTNNEAVLLVCTVGGTPDAIVASILRWRPQRVLFIASPETAAQVEGAILPSLAQNGVTLGPGQYETVQVPDAQDFERCVETLRPLGADVAQWAARGPSYTVVADFTGGTKCMSAALALVAHQWPCRFSYVGGTQRTKGGVGVVVSGKEQIVVSQNPWDVLGYQAAEEAALLFDQGNYKAAFDALQKALPKVSRPQMKQELHALTYLVQAYLQWDLFDHKGALASLKEAQRRMNDLCHLFPEAEAALRRTAHDHAKWLEHLREKRPSRQVVIDLLASARRCKDRGRYDDAVARLYRAVEATAQWRLAQRHGIPDTGKVPMDKLPEPLKGEWASRAKEGYVELALRHDYRLLAALGDDLGQKFHSMLDEHKLPLDARNKSILAHGFEPVGKEVCEPLWRGALDLAEVAEAELPLFPRLARTTSARPAKGEVRGIQKEEERAFQRPGTGSGKEVLGNQLQN